MDYTFSEGSLSFWIEIPIKENLVSGSHRFNIITSDEDIYNEWSSISIPTSSEVLHIQHYSFEQTIDSRESSGRVSNGPPGVSGGSGQIFTGDLTAGRFTLNRSFSDSQPLDPSLGQFDGLKDTGDARYGIYYQSAKLGNQSTWFNSSNSFARLTATVKNDFTESDFETPAASVEDSLSLYYRAYQVDYRSGTSSGTTFQFLFEDSSGTVFQSDQLPEILSLSEFDTATLSATSTDASRSGLATVYSTDTVRGSLTNLELIAETIIYPEQAVFNEELSIPGSIEAEDFDQGGREVAYFDRDAENLGDDYRDEGVDLLPSTESDGGYVVTQIEDGEWLEYTVDLSSGDYNFLARVAGAPFLASSIRVLIDGEEVGRRAVFADGGESGWRTLELSDLSLQTSGEVTLRLEFEGGGFALDWVRFETAQDNEGQAPFDGNLANIPDRVEAENFDTGGQGIGYQDNEDFNITGSYRDEGVDIEPSGDVDGSFGLGYFDSNEWVEYTVNVTPGIYRVIVRTASGLDNPAPLRLLMSGQELGLFVVPDTGAFNSWESSELEGIVIPFSGEQVLRIETTGDGTNLNWIEFEITAGAEALALQQAGIDYFANSFESQSLKEFAFGLNPNLFSGACGPFLFQSEEDDNGMKFFSVPVLAGGQGEGSSYQVGGMNYQIRSSFDLQEWGEAISVIPNPTGLPALNESYRWMSFRTHEGNEKAFFKVELDFEESD
ncbi:MAG: carbohydrate-binding protein [Roseibacillus sp.]